MRDQTSNLPVLVSGGGIGGLAAALALVRQGFNVQVFEQSAEMGEIGAGIQLGPNAFHAFDAFGVGDKARGRAVYTDCMSCTTRWTKAWSAGWKPATPFVSASAIRMR